MNFTVKQRAIASLCFVSLCFVLLNVAARFLSAGFGPFTQVYLRIGLGALLVILFFHKEIDLGKLSRINKKDWLILFLMGTIGYGFAVDFVTLGVLHTKLLNVTVISSTTPFFIFLFSIFILRKRFHTSLFLLLLLTFYGVCVVATRSLIPAFDKFGIGDFYTLLFAAGFGVFVLGRKFLSQHLNNSEIAIIIMFIAFVSSLLSALLVGEKLSLTGFSNSTALLGLAMGGILNLVSTKLQNFSFHHLNSVAASQLLLLSNVFAPLFGLFLFNEIVLPVEFIGALFVIIGVWAYNKYAED